MGQASPSTTARMSSSTTHMAAGSTRRATTITAKVNPPQLPRKVYLIMTETQATEVTPIFNTDDDFFEDIAKQYDYDDRRDDNYAEDEYSDE
jgi:hypothetical protein